MRVVPLSRVRTSRILEIERGPLLTTNGRGGKSFVSDNDLKPRLLSLHEWDPVLVESSC
jgi:hypothetical protein